MTIAGASRRTVERRATNGSERTDDLIANEVPVALHYNGQPFAVLMATPCDLPDLALGFSLSEGIVDTADALHIDSRELEATATSMVVVLTYWLSFEYVRDPRRALEPESAQAALLRGAHHVLNLLMPYLESGQRAHLLELVGAYAAVPG